MDDFQKNELIGRAKFKALLDKWNITDYKFTEGKFYKVNCSFTNPSKKKWIVEIKERDESIYRFPTLFMEVVKY